MNKLQRLQKFIPIAAALLLAACNSAPKPEEVAGEFLGAYLSTDYQKAATCCTPALSQDLLNALQEAEALNDEIKAKIKKHTPNYTPQIDSVVQNSSKDTVTVYYSIINRQATDTLTGGTQIIESALKLVKHEKLWRVNSLNK